MVINWLFIIWFFKLVKKKPSLQFRDGFFYICNKSLFTQIDFSSGLQFAELVIFQIFKKPERITKLISSEILKNNI